MKYPIGIRKISLLELFDHYEKAQASYMKTNGKFVIVPTEDGIRAALVNDARSRLQDYRNELLARLHKCEGCTR